MRKHVIVIILTPPPPKKKKKKTKKAWKGGGEEGAAAHRQIGITVRQTQKPLTLYQKDSSFMTLRVVHIENAKKGENTCYEHFLHFL